MFSTPHASFRASFSEGQTGSPVSTTPAGECIAIRNKGVGCSSPVNPQNPNGYIKVQCFVLPVATPAIASQCQPFGFIFPNVIAPGDPGSPGIPGTCANLLGNSGRNSVYGPGLVDFDFSLVKDTHIRENLNLEFRAEIFNLFNRANFNPPIANSALFEGSGNPNGAGGILNSTSTSRRQTQFALKLIF